MAPRASAPAASHRRPAGGPHLLAVLTSLCAPWATGPGALAGQAAITVVTPDRPVVAATPNASSPLTEPHVAVDPGDARHVVVGAIVAPVDDDSPWHCAALATFDGGSQWTRTDFAMHRCIDPWVTLLPNGDVLFVGIELLADVEGDDRFHLVSFRSTDGGRTWSNPSQSLGRAHEHAMLHADDGGSLYLLSRRMRRTPEGRPRHTIYLGRSDDMGRSFTDLAEMRPSNLALNVSGIASLPGRRLAVGYWDTQRNVDDFGRAGILERSRSWLYVLARSGRPRSDPLFITDACSSGSEGAFPGYPILAADVSTGSFGGRLYHACVLRGFDGIALTHSSDGGDVWSEPLRVDAPPAGATNHTRTAMLAVNAAGTVGLAWYDRRHDPERACQDLYFTASVDGGRTVLTPQRISTETSCPDVPGNGRAGRSWPMGGDYSSLAVGPDGRFHVVWADSRGGRFGLRYGVVEVAGRP